ncbi:MAG: NAD(P) transhydrogenase subunit alpha [Desulfuromonadales bacterium]|jgi:NAD(P) transhydrogenase subunit alpha|nr:NAD(P) transhydrogenase subunit alpha [Desulfuromonadales bacterium]
MTLIAIPNETSNREQRTAITPDNADRLVRSGAEVLVEAGLGSGCGFSDQQYRESGARVTDARHTLLEQADVVLRIHKPTVGEIALLQHGALHISYLDPFNERGLVEALKDQQVTAISMEMLPRTTRAQKMDALSSQASLAGYVMVIQAANRLNRILPMMMTPSGTIKPARVFVIGAGVAGLQAIATAKRLGARVTAFDTRTVVAEQVESLGAGFLKIDLGATSQTGDGYAQQLTAEQLAKQQQGQADEIAKSDIVITTAQVFGRKPPLLVTRDVVRRMRPGSVIVDMAAETGGNVEGSVAGGLAEIGGVTIIGSGSWSGQVSRDASDMYSNNLFNLVHEYWDAEQKKLVLDLNDDILSGCVITHAGEIVNETIRKQYA